MISVSVTVLETVSRGLMSRDREEVGWETLREGEHCAEPDGSHSKRRRWHGERETPSCETRTTSASKEKMGAKLAHMIMNLNTLC